MIYQKNKRQLLSVMILFGLYSMTSLIDASNGFDYNYNNSNILVVNSNNTQSIVNKQYQRRMAAILNNNINLANLSVAEVNDKDYTTPASQRPLYQNRRRFLFSGIVIVLGVIGNFLALLILARKKALKHNKYTFMLR